MKTNTQTTAPRYVCASFPAWREHAARSIAQGQTEADFLASCHTDNRTNARAAYQVERAARRVTPTRQA